MIPMASRYAFGGFTFTAFNRKHPAVVVKVMTSPSLMESSTFFFLNQSYSFHCIGFLIIGSKNYLFHTGKDNNHANNVDVNNALCCPTSIVLRPKNIPTVVEATVIMSSPSSIGFLMFFCQSQSLIYCIDLKHLTSFWWLILFFIDEIFVFRLKSVIFKKYTNTNGKDSKYTNAINISIIWSCGGGVGNTGSLIA